MRLKTRCRKVDFCGKNFHCHTHPTTHNCEVSMWRSYGLLVVFDTFYLGNCVNLCYVHLCCVTVCEPRNSKTVWNQLRNTHIQTHERVILFKPDHKLRSGLARGLHQSWGGVRIGELLTDSWLKCSGRLAASLIPLLPQSPQ